MRDAWLPLGLVLLVGAATLLACGQAFTIAESTGTGTGGGAGGGSSSSVGGGGSGSSVGSGGATAGGTTTSTGGTQCITAAECPGSAGVCSTPLCTGGKCGIMKLQPAGDLYSELYGDCHVQKCTPNGALVNQENNADVYDDGNICTKDECKGGVPSNTPVFGGQCPNNGHCNSQGVCVRCLDDNNCDGGKKCISDRCLPNSCTDGSLALGETDTDCGGSACAPCVDSKRCLLGSDCQSGVCDIPPGESMLKCRPPTCIDKAKNGHETDVDCGGPDCQVKCLTNKSCKLGSDCLSGVCQSGTCRLETCTDGVKNGAEKGIDCGSGVSPCPACP